MKQIWVLSLLGCAASGVVFAAPSAKGVQEPLGAVLRLEGTGVLLSNPSSSAAGPSPRVKFEGLYYTSNELKAGLPVKSGSVLRTGPASKALVAFGSGDHFAVGPGTSCSIHAQAGRSITDQRQTSVELRQGSLRGVIRPADGNSGLHVKSRAAELMVRDAEFFIEDAGAGPVESRVAALHGKVEVSLRTPTSTGRRRRAVPTESVSREIDSGSAARVIAPILSERYRDTKIFDAMEFEEAVIDVTPLYREEIARIRSATAISAGKSPAELPELELAAGRAVLALVSAYEPDLSREFEGKGANAPAADVERLTAASFDRLLERSPATPANEVHAEPKDLSPLQSRSSAVLEEALPPSSSK